MPGMTIAGSRRCEHLPVLSTRQCGAGGKTDRISGNKRRQYACAEPSTRPYKTKPVHLARYPGPVAEHGGEWREMRLCTHHTLCSEGARTAMTTPVLQLGDMKKPVDDRLFHLRAVSTGRMASDAGFTSYPQGFLVFLMGKACGIHPQNQTDPAILPVATFYVPLEERTNRAGPLAQGKILARTHARQITGIQIGIQLQLAIDFRHGVESLVLDRQGNPATAAVADKVFMHRLLREMNPVFLNDTYREIRATHRI